MRWKDLRRSSNVRDVRGAGGGGRMPLRTRRPRCRRRDRRARHPRARFRLGRPGSRHAAAQRRWRRGAERRARPPADRQRRGERLRRARARQHRGRLGRAVCASRRDAIKPPELTLFAGAVQSACGYASSASGPFYCPSDQRVYLDTAFFDELARMGGPGDFAAAYVIGHEVGHHVQTLLGTSDQVRAAQQRGERGRGESLASRDGAAGRLLRRRLGESREPDDARARARRRRGRARRRRGHRRRSVAAQRRAQRDARLVHARLLRGAAALALNGPAHPAIPPPAILSTSHTGTRGMLDNRLFDGRAVRDRILDGVAARVHAGAAKHSLGRLVSISIGEHKEVAVYVRGQASAAKKVGIPFEDQTWPAHADAGRMQGAAARDERRRERARRDSPTADPEAHPRPLAGVRDPSAEGHRGHEPGLDRRHRLQRLGARAVHGRGLGRAHQSDGPEPARPRGRHDRPLGDRR